jgi:putative pyoverdin transport system ATP-binding/permease protein
MKQILSYLMRRRSLLGLALGLLAGLGTSLVFVALREALRRAPHLTGRELGWFVGLCLGTQACQLGSETLLFRQAEGLLLELRLRFARQVVEMPLRRQEQLGSARVLAAFTEDIPALVKPIREIGQLANNLVMAAVCLAYLAIWSWRIVLGVTLFVVVGIGAVRTLVGSAQAHVKAARGEQDRLLGHLRALTEGAKELKLHRRRRQALISEVLRASGEALARHNVALESRFAAAGSFGNGLFYVLMGLIIWLSQYVKGLGGPGLGGFVLVVSFVVGPIFGIFRMAPSFSRAAGALANVEKLGLSLREKESEAPAAAAPAPGWRSLELRGVEHSFRGEDQEEGFVLGPLSLTLSPGEVVFVTGGNGSGKTTLAKLLTGLYAPDRGEVVLDGRVIGEAERSQYREGFAAVFFDFFLFDSLLGLDWPRLEGKTRQYLHRFGLADKVAVREGKLSTLDLSQGQRRRLALLTAYLEERPICVFDEWAADQDAPFRETFYRDLLPELKAQGRTVVVISHDERYYHVADRVLRLEYGRLLETSGRECTRPGSLAS